MQCYEFVREVKFSHSSATEEGACDHQGVTINHGFITKLKVDARFVCCGVECNTDRPVQCIDFLFSGRRAMLVP